MQKLLLALLALLARAIIDFHKPIVIGITGTVGKTTVTSHVYGYLSYALPNKRIWYSKYHYNGEYGLPLTIIWARTGGKNPILWIWVFIVGLSRFFRSYPEYLVLEYGIDHPGEMDFLTSIVVPDVAILTEVAPNHLEQFGTLERYRTEKLKLIRDAKDLIIHDSLRSYVEREAFFYGAGWMSDIDIADVHLDMNWTRGVVNFHRTTYPIAIRAFWWFHLVNTLPLYALSHIFSLDTKQVAEYIVTVEWEPGRSSLLSGKYGTKIIDGSYNWWYLSLHAGILSLESFLPENRLICIIWDMRELGADTEKIHIQLATEIAESYQSLWEYVRFYLVWPHMQKYVAPILGMNFHTEVFFSSRDAWNTVLRYLDSSESPEKNIIFVKWSQNTIFLEEAIEILLENREDTKKLCRQSEDWKRKKEDFFSTLWASRV